MTRHTRHSLKMPMPITTPTPTPAPAITVEQAVLTGYARANGDLLHHEVVGAAHVAAHRSELSGDGLLALLLCDLTEELEALALEHLDDPSSAANGADH